MYVDQTLGKNQYDKGKTSTDKWDETNTNTETLRQYDYRHTGAKAI